MREPTKGKSSIQLLQLLMEEISTTQVPIGSLAVILSVIFSIVFIAKAVIARQKDFYDKSNLLAKGNKIEETLEDKKRRLELLLKK